jgi:hypothetical protein
MKSPMVLTWTPITADVNMDIHIIEMAEHFSAMPE